MKIFLIFMILIGVANAEPPMKINLLKFEKMLWNLIEVIVPKYKQLHQEIKQIVAQDPNGNGTSNIRRGANNSKKYPNSYLYVYPNIPKTVGQIYTSLKTCLKQLISSFPQLVNLPGVGPNIDLSYFQYTQIKNGFNNILMADIAAGNVLSTQHNLLLQINSEADISTDGKSLYVPIPELEEIMQLTLDFNMTNVFLGKTFQSLSIISDVLNIEKQASSISSNVLTAFINFLKSVGNNFIVAGLAGSDLSLNIRLASHLHDNQKTYVVNLQSLYNAWNSAGIQCMVSYDTIGMDMDDLLKSFYGSYETVQIPM